MSLFGNSTFSTIFYIFSIVVTFCITIKLRERLNLYIENKVISISDCIKIRKDLSQHQIKLK